MAYNYRDIPQIVREILAAKAEDGGVKNVYFVGCGGSLLHIFADSRRFPFLPPSKI